MSRKDGESTRKRILDAALQLFGEKGFHHATHAEVCERADANIAAINYHFRTKDQLYRDVCEYAIASMAERYPPGGTIPPDATPETRLHAHIEAVILRSRVPAPLHYYHNLRMMEMFNPTGLVDDIWDAWLGCHRDISRAIIEDLLGPQAAPDDVSRCQMSLLGSCYIANSFYTSGNKRNAEGTYLDDAGAVIAHIYQFTLAGIRAVAGEIEVRSSRAGAV